MNPNTKIQKFLEVNRFKISLAALVIMFLGILYLSSRVTRPAPFIPTVPITPSPGPEFKLSTLPENYNYNFGDSTNISITNNSQVFAINKSKRLVIYLGDQSYPISPSNTDTVTYSSRGNSIVYETGVQGDPDNSFYIFNLVDKSNTKIDLAEFKPVISYYLSPDEKNLAFIGKYDVQAYTGKLYIHNFETNSTNEVAEEVVAGDVTWIDPSNIMITKEIDSNINTHTINIYSIKDNAIVIQQLPYIKKSLSVNFDKSTIYFVNSVNNRLSALDLNTYKFNILPVQKNPNIEIAYNNKNNTLILINTDTPGVIGLQTVDINTGNVIKNNQIDLDPNTVYIEKFISKGNYYYKIYDRNTKQYTVKTFPIN